MEDEKIPQQMLENPMMVDKNVNLSYVFSIDVDEPHFFVEALNMKIHNIGKRPWILNFNIYKTIIIGYLFLFHLITN
jgi:hypothetical protein